MLDEKFKKNNIPVYYSLGNHEKYPNDAYHDVEDYMLKNMADVYKDYLNEEAYETFKKNGYYSINYDKNLKIISINCLVCDSFNFNLFNSTKQHAKRMFSWLEEELKKAEEKNEYVYILNHFPLNGEFTLTECAKRFQALFDRYEYNIRGIFSGHTHRDDIEGISSYFDKNKIVNLNFVAPQLTTYSSKLPSYRIYTIDAETKQVLDYEQFRFNLKKSNEEKKPNWYLAYKASEFYGVKNLLEYNNIINNFSKWEQYVLNQ
jgi:sphingomyelin phosphodiesterase